MSSSRPTTSETGRENSTRHGALARAGSRLRIIKPATTALAALLLAGGALALAPQSAQAASGDGTASLADAALTVETASANAELDGAQDCPDNYFCLWADSEYTGDSLYVNEPDLFQPSIEPAMNDRTTSMVNWSNTTVCIYDDADFGGEMLGTLGPDQAGIFGAPGNDRVSSFRPC